MLKSTLAALVALLILSSVALAAPICNPLTVTGSYVRQSPLANSGLPTLFIDQLRLGIDGTAYWYNSDSFDYFLTSTFIPTIGSWTCLADGTVLVTTIGTTYYNPSGDIPQTGVELDIYNQYNLRVTQKLSVVDISTLEPTYQIFTYVLLTNNPLGPGTSSGSCMPSGPACNPAPYKKILPQLTDIP